MTQPLIEVTREIVDVEVNEDVTEVVPVYVDTEVVEVLVEGPPGRDGVDGVDGAQGPPGSTTLEEIVITFATGTSVWEVDNPFVSRRPIVETTDMSGSVIEGDISFPSGKIRVEWGFDQTGYIRLT